MIKFSIWWLITSPPWRRVCILLLLLLSTSIVCWIIAGNAAQHHSVQLEENQRRSRKSAALCLQQLAELPGSALLRLRQKQHQQRTHFLARGELSLSELLRESQAHLLQWQTSSSTRSLKLDVTWPQVALVMRTLLLQLPDATISKLTLSPGEKKLHMNLVMEINDEPAMATANNVL